LDDAQSKDLASEAQVDAAKAALAAAKQQSETAGANVVFAYMPGMSERSLFGYI